MALQIRCYVNGNQEFIDLYGNETIELEISFAEIQDISKRNSPFTKEFKVPGSKNNNTIFNYYYDLNATFTSWNPKKKFEADLLYNGYELYNGNIRLNSVSINNTEKIYSITFYSSVGDMVANIGDKALCDVDTSSLNHTLYDTDICDNLFFDPSLHKDYTTILGIPQNPVMDGDVNYILGQRGYDYTGSTFGDIRDINIYQTPLLDFSGVTGFFDFSGTPLISSYLIPSIRTRKLYELIVNQAGYNIESSFFDGDYFGRYYIPLSFNTENVYMAQSQPYQFEIINTSGYTSQKVQDIQLFGSSSILSYNMVKSETITKDNLGFNPINPADYSSYGPSLSAYTDYLFALPWSNGADMVYEMTISNVYTGSTFCANPPACGDFIGEYYLCELINISGSTLIARQAGQSQFYGFDSGPNATNKYYYTGQTQNAKNINGTSLYFMAYFFYPSFNTGWNVTGTSFNLLTTPQILPKTIELNKEMSCEQKQIEFIQNINKTFNLVVVEHPVKPKTLIIEPMVDYIGKGNVLDWTDKVDYDATQNILPTTTFFNGSLFLANKQDKDFINTEYNKRSNQIFGQNTIDFGVDYKNQTINLVQTLGQNTDYYLNASGNTNVALPCYFITKENNNKGTSVFEYRPFRSLPRQVFKSVSIPTGNTLSNPFFYRYGGTNTPFTTDGFVAYGTFPNINRFTTYPINISGFSHYTIYDSSNKFTEDEVVYPDADNMYDRYYRDYAEDLVSDENKVYECKMYLTPWEIANLYYDETIIIKNTKFRINKISGLSLLEPGLCSVQLVKLTRDYEPTPILFYDLISCDDPNDIIHTHTDLIYPIFAFENKFVEIAFDNNSGNNKRYEVVRTTYNDQYTYETPYFAYYSVNRPNYQVWFDYQMYNSCSATTPSFVLNIN